MFLYCWQWHAAQQCVENVLLRFHGKNVYANVPKCCVVSIYTSGLPPKLRRTWLFKSSNPEIYWRNPWERSLIISYLYPSELCIWRKKESGCKVTMMSHIPWRLATDKNIVEREWKLRGSNYVYKETGKEKWHECRATIQKEGGLGMFSANLRTRSSVSGRLQAGYRAWHVWSAGVAAFVCRSFFPPILLPLSFIPSFSSVFPHLLHSFPRFVPMDVT